MTEIVPADGWLDLAARVAAAGGVTMLVGDCDAGKSSLALWLADELSRRGRRPVLIDADVGQPGFCPPGSVGLAEREVELGWRCRRFTFLGSPSPVRVFGPLVAAVGRYCRDAAGRASHVILDTSGLVSGELGVRLKLAKIEAVRPTTVAAVQRSDECEPLLALLPKEQAVRLAQSPLAVRRNPETRTRYREERIRQFLPTEPAERIFLREETELVYLGRDVSFGFPAIGPGTVAGLEAKGETAALGIVQEIDHDSATLLVPPGKLPHIRRLVCGEIVAPVPIQDWLPIL